MRYPSSTYILFNEDNEPESFFDVLSHKNKEKWIHTMNDEMNSLEKNDTNKLVELPNRKNFLENKWISCKGFNQKEDIDFDEIFSLVIKLSFITIALGLVASMNLELEELDIKTTFLHGNLNEVIYMEQPESFKENKKEHVIYKLKMSYLYGLKQALR
jgi:hypothetical protein